MPYVADPWNNAAPTNANTVKDVVPAELVALKQVNLDRVRLWCAGLINIGEILTYTNGNSTAVGLTPYTQVALFKGAFASSQGAGSVYTVDQQGWFKINATLTRLAAYNSEPDNSSGGTIKSYMECLVVQKALAATPTTWFNVNQCQVPGTQYFAGGTLNDLVMDVTSMAFCAVGDKLRIQHVVNLTGTTLSGTANLAPRAETAQLDTLLIEFMRT